jgi:hypothetical protein
MRDETTPREQSMLAPAKVPPILKAVMENARHTPSPEEDAAAWRLVLGQSTLGEYLRIVHAIRSR